MNANQELVTGKLPDILDIKPLEELEKPNADDLEDVTRQDIFIKPENKTAKKKKPLSERQKAHLLKMRQRKAANDAKRAAAKQAKKEMKAARKAEKQKIPQKTQQIQQKTQQIQQKEPQIQQKTQQIPQKPQMPQMSQGGQAYMREFFQNMNMFIDSANKINSFRSQTKANTPAKNATPQTTKKSNSSSKKSKPKSNDTYFVDFLKPSTSYNHKNSFGI